MSDTIQFVKTGVKGVIRSLDMAAARIGVPLDPNSRALQSFKDKHAGRRAFIIGNGPSLKAADLDRLANEITFAANRVYLVFEQTAWRPTYYTVEDIDVARTSMDQINKLTGLTRFFPHYLKTLETPPNGGIFYHTCSDKDAGNMPSFHTDCLEHVNRGNTVTFSSMQLAFYMGIREVYLLGMDHNFGQPPLPSGEKSAAVYFHPDYAKNTQTWKVSDMRIADGAFQNAKAAFAEAGGEIVNATRGGKLEVFRRLSFDEIPGLPAA